MNLLFPMNLIRSLTKQNPLATALLFLLLGESLFGETVVFSGRTMQHDILLLLNPPSAQLFVKDLDKEDIHNHSLTFDGSSLYCLHETWPDLKSKRNDAKWTQWAEVYSKPIPLHCLSEITKALWLPTILQCHADIVLTNLSFL